MNGCLTLVWLVWIGFMPSSLPPSVPDFSRQYPVTVVMTAAFSLFLLVSIAPLVWRGPRRVRWLALSLTVVPFLVFGFTALWLAAWSCALLTPLLKSFGILS